MIHSNNYPLPSAPAMLVAVVVAAMWVTREPLMAAIPLPPMKIILP
jgi:hypothetical protein